VGGALARLDAEPVKTAVGEGRGSQAQGRDPQLLEVERDTDGQRDVADRPVPPRDRRRKGGRVVLEIDQMAS